LSFLPTNISSLLAWCEADADVYQDAGMATPCTNGTTVYTWKNQYAAGIGNAVQAVAGSRPTFTTGGQNGKPYINFSTKFLRFAHAAKSQPITICAAMQPLGTFGGANPACFFASLTGGTFYMAGSNAAMFTRLSAGTTVTGTVAIGTAAAHIYTAEFNSPNSKTWVDATADLTAANTNTNGVTNLCVGDLDGTLVATGDMNLYELIIYNKVLPTFERIQLEDYLATKYAISGPLVVPSGKDTVSAASRVVGWLRFININNDYYQVGVRKETTEGNPLTPCLAIDQPGRWRFRWAFEAGTRAMTIMTKQVSNVTGKRPRVIVKANPQFGLNADVVADAGSGAGWVTIGPLIITPASDGATWVELWNMDTDTFKSPAYFDHAVVT
jgi:hypothetical protein